MEVLLVVFRAEMSEWTISEDGHKWSVKLDVRDLGGHLDSTLWDRACILAVRIRAVWSTAAGGVLPFGFMVQLDIIFLACLHGWRAPLSVSSLSSLRAAIVCVQPSYSIYLIERVRRDVRLAYPNGSFRNLFA